MTAGNGLRSGTHPVLGRQGLRFAFGGTILAIGSLVPTLAVAYVGPGAGITLLGSLVAVILALLLAAGGLLTWPIRSMRRRKREQISEGRTADPQKGNEPGVS